MKTSEIVDQHQLLQHLYNIQKARCYDYFILVKLLKTENPHNRWEIYERWCKESSNFWESITRPHLQFKFYKVKLAKKAFEKAGGRYEDF